MTTEMGTRYSTKAVVLAIAGMALITVVGLYPLLRYLNASGEEASTQGTGAPVKLAALAVDAAVPKPLFEPGEYSAAAILGHTEVAVTAAIGVQPTATSDERERRYDLGRGRFLKVTFEKKTAVKLLVEHPGQSTTVEDMLAWLSVTNADTALDFHIGKRKYISLRTDRHLVAFTSKPYFDLEKWEKELLANAVGAIARLKFADTLDTLLLEQGTEATVSVGGKYNTTLLVTSFICSRVFLHELEQTRIGRAVSNAGFTCFKCSNGYETWGQGCK